MHTKYKTQRRKKLKNSQIPKTQRKKKSNKKLKNSLSPKIKRKKKSNKKLKNNPRRKRASYQKKKDLRNKKLNWEL